MNPLPRIGEPLETGTSSKPAGDPPAWLKQLESAQWQQRLRYERAGTAPKDAGESGARQAAQGKTGTTATRPDMHTAHASNSRQQAGNTEQAAHRFAQSAPLNGGNKPALDPVAARQGATTQPAAPAGDEELQSSLLGRRMSRMEWKTAHAHALLGSGEIRLWLRDARLRAGDGERLLRSLRGHFAQLGLKLVEFTLNGSTVASDPSRIEERGGN